MIVTYVKNVSEAMIVSLPSFWRIAKNFLDGKYKRVGRSRILHGVRLLSGRLQILGGALLNVGSWHWIS